MLSRIAEALFWVGRYVERAEGTARLLDVQLQLLAEDPSLDEPAVCRDLLAAVGVPADGPLDRRRVLDLLAYDETAPTSVAASLRGARESALRAGEAVSEELWEVLDTAAQAVPSGRWRSASPHTFCAWVRDRTAAAAGAAEATTSRGEGWLFLVLGRSLERADATSRLVTATADLGGPASRWPALLRACGAQETHLTSCSREEEAGAAELVLLDRLFPRSVVSALAQAERCLAELEPAGQRAGALDDAQRRLGRARAELEYRPLADVVAHLPEEMERVQRTCAAVSDAVARRCFSGADAVAWAGGLV